MSTATRTSLRGLRTFCLAARYESFQAAGDVLAVTASAVSHQIKNLEQELGIDLFDRGGALKLTSAGRQLYEEAGPLIDELDAIAAKFKARGQRRTVRVSVQPFFASELFVPRLKEFSAGNPDIDIQVSTSDETQEKHPADADLSVRLFRSPPPELLTDLLFPLKMVPAGSPEFRDSLKVRNKKIVSDFPIIVHETRPDAWTNWASQAGIALPEGKKVVRFDSMIAVVRAAERGLGAALVPVPMANSYFESGSLVPLFRQELIADVSYYLACKPDRAGDPAVDALRHWILESFAEAG